MKSQNPWDSLYSKPTFNVLSLGCPEQADTVLPEVCGISFCLRTFWSPLVIYLNSWGRVSTSWSSYIPPFWIRTIGRNQNTWCVSADVPATLLCFTAVYYTSNIVFSSIRGQCITHSAHCRLEVESLLYPGIQNHWNVFNSSVFHRLIFKEKKILDYKSLYSCFACEKRTFCNPSLEEFMGEEHMPN